jgi:hypothetical protein
LGTLLSGLHPGGVYLHVTITINVVDHEHVAVDAR